MTQKQEGKMHRDYFSSMGWALIIYSLIMNAMVVLVAVYDAFMIGMRQGMGEDISQEQLESILMSNGWGYLITIAIGLLAIRIWKGKRFCHETLWTRGKPMRFGSFMGILCVFISGQFAFQVLASIQESILNVFGLSAMEEIESATMDYDTFSMFLYAGVGAPIMEEIIFRGVVLRHLEPYGKRFAIVMSAFLFGIFHGNLVQIPYAFLVGLVLGYVAVEYNILWAMVLHMINNLVLGDLLTRLTAGLPEMMGDLIFSNLILGCSLVAVILLMVRRKDIDAYWNENPISDRRAGDFFTAPGVLALELLTLFSVASPLIDQIVEKMLTN